MRRRKDLRAPALFAWLTRWLAALVGAGLATTAPVSAQPVSPSAAPAEWVRYAEGATAAITQWLKADSEAGVRFRTYLDRTRPAEDQPTPPLEVKVWIAPDGKVERIDFASFAHPEPNADLRALIVGHRLAGPPPRDMLLPIRIAVDLGAAAADPI